MSQSPRAQRVADLIQRTLAHMLQREVRDPRFSAVNITYVDVSADLKNATVYFTILDDTKIKETQTALNNASGYLRHLLADAVELRITPKILFRYDESISRADRIARLIEQEDKKNKE